MDSPGLSEESILTGEELRAQLRGSACLKAEAVRLGVSEDQALDLFANILEAARAHAQAYEAGDTDEH